MHAVFHAFMTHIIHDSRIAVKGVRFLVTVYKPSDLVLSHPHYHDMIPYDGLGVGEGETGVARVTALHHYRDSRPVIAQPLNRNLSEIGSVSHVKSNRYHNERAIHSLVQVGLLNWLRNAAD
jgi:hypothetical protein